MEARADGPTIYLITADNCVATRRISHHVPSHFRGIRISWRSLSAYRPSRMNTGIRSGLGSGIRSGLGSGIRSGLGSEIDLKYLRTPQAIFVDEKGYIVRRATVATLSNWRLFISTCPWENADADNPPAGPSHDIPARVIL